jgi:hypothetical protein
MSAGYKLRLSHGLRWLRPPGAAYLPRETCCLQLACQPVAACHWQPDLRRLQHNSVATGVRTASAAKQGSAGQC